MNGALVKKNIELAAQKIFEASAILITSGAGFCVDSGLPDFRGPEGFWKAYPPMKKLGLRLEDLSNPKTFYTDPELAWGFFAHRYHIYTTGTPHSGYSILKEIATQIEKNNNGNPSYFVATSNSSGHFLRFFEENRVNEKHGSIQHCQCLSPFCGLSHTSQQIDEVAKEKAIWKAEKSDFEKITRKIDYNTFRLPFKNDPELKQLLTCPNCGKNIIRPNLLMFGDHGWLPYRSEWMEKNENQFLKEFDERSEKEHRKLVVIELGAGSYVPSIRIHSSKIADKYEGTLIRVNPRDYENDFPMTGSFKYIPISLTGLKACQLIQQGLKNKRFFDQKILIEKN